MQVSHRIFGDAGNLDKKEAEIAPCFLGFPVKSDVLRAPPNRQDRHAPTPAPVIGSLVIAMPPIGRMSVAPLMIVWLLPMIVPVIDLLGRC